MISILVFVMLIFSSTSQAISAESQKLDRVRIGYSSISSSRIALWVASDMGFFKNNGLAAEAIVTPGVQGTQALMPVSCSFIWVALTQLRWRSREDPTWSPWPLRNPSNTS
jgi:hypothetical protein